MKVKCPTCENSLEWSTENAFRPFCSHRCKLIDLGEWASENRTIATPMTPLDEFDPELEESLLSQDHLH